MRTQAILFAVSAVFAAGAKALPNAHPLLPPLACRTESRSYVQAHLFKVEGGRETKLATFSSIDPTGLCELSWRNARNDIVCMPKNGNVTTYNVKTGQLGQSFGSEYSKASYQSCWKAVNKDQLTTRVGYLDYIDPARLAPFKAKLPQIDDPEVQAVLDDPETMFYDEAAMTFTYQDSEGSPQGLRSNRVGWDVGSNSDTPDIKLLVNYFEPGHFRSPFKTAAGTDLVPEENKYLLNFYRLPKVNGKTVPVKYWKVGSHWRWTFPIGTYFGEILFQKAPDDGSWHVFEVRTRKRYLAGWATNAFRPFTRAIELAAAIKQARSNWAESDLSTLVTALETNDTLQPYKIEGKAYAKIFQPIVGAIDYLPETRDYALIKQLLDTTPFKSAEGQIWKESGTLETYAPSTKAAFSIVPKDYEAGVIAVNEVSCTRCHDQTARRLEDLDYRIVLYGEVWGEDRIFTWHLFDVDADSFSVSDGNRRINNRLVQAGLVEPGQPSASDARYGKILLPPSN